MWYFSHKEKCTHHKIANIFSCVDAVGSVKGFNDIMNLWEDMKIDQVKQSGWKIPDTETSYYVCLGFILTSFWGCEDESNAEAL